MVLFEGLARRGKKVKVDGIEFLIRPSVKDCEAYLSDDKESKAKVGEAFVSMICKGQADSKVEDVEAFVGQNLGHLMTEIPIALGFLNREELESRKAKLLEDASKKVTGN